MSSVGCWLFAVVLMVIGCSYVVCRGSYVICDVCCLLFVGFGCLCLMLVVCLFCLVGCLLFVVW